MTSSLERTLVLMCAGCWFLGNAAACQAQQTEADAKLVETIRAAAEKGDPGEQYALGEIYFFSEGGVTQDYAKAVYWFRKAAEQGHGKAQSWLGVCYEHGDGVAKDIAEAVRWYQLLLHWRGGSQGLRRGVEMVSQGRRAGRSNV